MTRKWLVLLTIVSVLIFVVAGCAPAAPPVEKPPVEKPPVEKIVWKFAAYGPPPDASVVTRAYVWFFDEVAKRSEGRFECKYFYAASLCPAKEQPDGLKSGLMEASYFVSAYYPSKLPVQNIAYLAYLFPFTEVDKKNFIAFINVYNEWCQTPPIKDEFAKWDATLISEAVPVFYNFMGRVRISSIEDMKGVKIRAVGGMAKLLTEVGAVPVFTTVPELYDALSKGVVDVAAHAYMYFYTLHLYEVSKYWTVGVNLGQMPATLAAGTRAYEALPQDIKDIFEEIKKEYPGVVADFYVAEKEIALEAFDKKGIELVQFSPADKKKLREPAMRLWKEKVDKLEEEGLPGREAFNSLQDIIKKYVPDFEPYHL